MFVPCQFQDESQLPRGFDENTNHMANNGTGWWLEMDSTDGDVIRISSFQGGPIMAQFRRDMADPEYDAITEIINQLKINR